MGSLRRAAPLLALLVCGACRENPELAEAPTGVPIQAGSGGSTGQAATSGAGGQASSDAAPAFRIATWNLHNFSPYGTAEFRIGSVAATIEELDADLLAVQELKVQEGTQGESPQAWDALLDELEEGSYQGLHNPWSTFDSTVGLLYRGSTVEILASRALFENDSHAFPRPPLEVEVAVTKEGSSIELTVIVLHLKAFGDSVDRRRAACAALESYLGERPSERVVVLGDLNDDPYDPPADNAFTGTFLDAEPHYLFVTQAFPPESVTSLGYYHYVGDTKITGELLDHVILTGPLAQSYATIVPSIRSVVPEQYDDWEWDYSDHFPVVVDLSP
jgi:endonuclease/exonuclease/phosphatase family metal-dependent hydrolase